MTKTGIIFYDIRPIMAQKRHPVFARIYGIPFNGCNTENIIKIIYIIYFKYIGMEPYQFLAGRTRTVPFSWEGVP